MTLKYIVHLQNRKHLNCNSCALFWPAFSYILFWYYLLFYINLRRYYLSVFNRCVYLTASAVSSEVMPNNFATRVHIFLMDHLYHYCFWHLALELVDATNEYTGEGIDKMCPIGYIRKECRKYYINEDKVTRVDPLANFHIINSLIYLSPFLSGHHYFSASLC